jgi:hypothetical protein
MPEMIKMRDIDVERNYRTLGSDRVGEPRCDRPATSPDFRAPPTRCDPAVFEQTKRAGVVVTGKDGESLVLVARTLLK